MATPGGGNGGTGGLGDDDGVLRVNVWSTPRTLSTALLYSFNQVRVMCGWTAASGRGPDVL